MRPGTSVLTLRQARYLRALSQRELAERAGLTHVQVSRIESGAVAPQPSTRRALAQALGGTPNRIAWPGAEVTVGAVTHRQGLLTK
jgi:transcriptional regulator with XRE-family HTH domain